MLSACSLVGDQRRAVQWCGAADRFAEKYGCPFLQARCRSHYGLVLLAHGDWDQAEIEFNQALEMSADCGREPRVEALAGLAELRFRQGAVEEAAAMLNEVGDLPSAVVITGGGADRAGSSGSCRRRPADPAGRVGGSASRSSRSWRPVWSMPASPRAVPRPRPPPSRLCTASTHQHPQTAALTQRADGLVAAATGDADLRRAASASGGPSSTGSTSRSRRRVRGSHSPGSSPTPIPRSPSSRLAGPSTGWSGSGRFASFARRRRFSEAWGLPPSRDRVSSGCCPGASSTSSRCAARADQSRDRRAAVHQPSYGRAPRQQHL